MISRYRRLAQRIRDELSGLDSEVKRAAKAWEMMSGASDPDPYIDSAALNLHGFYSGIERLFELIATQVDEYSPSGEAWHRTLLNRMARPAADIRPAVIQPQTAAKLDEYRKFRHLVRNVYTSRLDAARMSDLMIELGPLWDQVAADLKSFADFLDELSTADEADTE